MQHDQDLAVAAAYASGNSHAQQRHMPYADTAHLHDFGFQQYEQDSYEGGYGDLPSVDDLEVAAAAAAAAMDEADMGGGLSSSSNEDDEDESSSAETSGSDDGSSKDESGAEGLVSSAVVKTDLFVTANGEVKVLIRPLIVEQSNGMRLQEPSDSDTSSESDIEEITDICDMREIISRMDDDDDGDHDKDEAAAQLAPVEPLHVEIGESEPLLAAGTISSILEGTIVVQEAENGRALCEGTVLCSEDRIAIGRIEDTFGPVMCPLYTLRWAGRGDMPSSLALDAPVFTTQKLAEYLLAEQLYTNGAAAEDDLEEEEIEFSDDEKEAEYKRKLKAKRKQRDGLEADLGGARGSGRGGRGGARRGRMESPGPARGWSGGRGNGRNSHGGAFNSMQANVTAGQMAGMQLNSPGPLPQSAASTPSYNGGYAPPPSDPSFQQGYAEGLRMAQQQLAQQHLQQMPFQQQSYQQYWHPQQMPAPGFMGGPPPPYNPSIMPASPAMGPPTGWQPYGQPPQQVTGQAANFFRGRGRGRRGGRS
ncbi:hypothetical protein WJX82_002315 [Trebouxia sp. C0006]